MCEIGYDEFGPMKVLHLYSAKAALKAIVVIDNIALGPALGGVRVRPEATAAEVRRLARTMTLKNSAAGIAHGGGKAAILADPKRMDRERAFRAFARLIKDVVDFIPGPDMGSDERCMAWIYDETGRAAGLPAELGGLPVDSLGATGFGLAECAIIACPYAGVRLESARVAIQGFGSVGRAAARFLSKKGALLIAASDSAGAVHNAGGLDVERLLEVKAKTGSVMNYEKGSRIAPGELFALQCDILIPAATPDVINETNVHEIKAKLILEGANIPATEAAEEALARRGVLVVPDFIANSGGVIMAAMEYAKKSENEAFAAISETIKNNTSAILEKSKAEGVPPRRAAVEIAARRVREAMESREV